MLSRTYQEIKQTRERVHMIIFISLLKTVFFFQVVLIDRGTAGSRLVSNVVQPGSCPLSTVHCPQTVHSLCCSSLVGCIAYTVHTEVMKLFQPCSDYENSSLIMKSFLVWWYKDWRWSSRQKSNDTKENFYISYRDRNLRSHPADLSGIIQRNSLDSLRSPQNCLYLACFGIKRFIAGIDEYTDIKSCNIQWRNAKINIYFSFF